MFEVSRRADETRIRNCAIRISGGETRREVARKVLSFRCLLVATRIIHFTGLAVDQALRGPSHTCCWSYSVGLDIAVAVARVRRVWILAVRCNQNLRERHGRELNALHLTDKHYPTTVAPHFWSRSLVFPEYARRSDEQTERARLRTNTLLVVSIFKCKAEALSHFVLR